MDGRTGTGAHRRVAPRAGLAAGLASAVGGLAGTVPAAADDGDALYARSAWVLVDQEARDAGIVLEVSGQEVDATLPVEVERDLELTVVDGERWGSVWAQSGFVYRIQGKRGKVRVSRPGIDVDLDCVALYADAAAAQSVADEVHAAVTPDGGRWLLRGEDVLYELAYASVPEGDLDVALLPVPAAPTPSASVSVSVSAGTATTAVTAADERRRRRAHVRSSRSKVSWERGMRIDNTVTPEPIRGATSDTVSWRLTPADHPRETAPAGSRTPVELVAWYCDAAQCVVLGVDGRAHRCDATGCVEAGLWSSGPGDAWVDVGRERYVWAGGRLVRVSSSDVGPEEVQP